MNILIITRSDDNYSIKRVTEALEAKGDTVIRFNTDQYPTDVMMAAQYSDDKRFLKLIVDGKSHDLNEVDAIWYRRLNLGDRIPRDLEKQMLTASIEETKRTFIGMLDSLGKFTLDPYQKVRYSGNKQLQIQIAAALGIAIPQTIFTNDAKEVLEFSKQVSGPVITKMQHSFAIYEQGEENVVFTNVIGEEELNNLEGLELCPMTFQEKVEKKVELRITIVGDKVFTAAIDPNTSERAQTDWRRDGNNMIHDWVKYELPQEISEKLLKLMDRLGLNYGAIDVIVTPDDRYVFLEVNPSGEFFWLDWLFEGQISEAIADVLSNKDARRNNNILIEENWM